MVNDKFQATKNQNQRPLSAIEFGVFWYSISRQQNNEIIRMQLLTKSSFVEISMECSFLEIDKK